MIIYKCDRCGKEKKVTKGIVGNEFEHGFETLAHSFRSNNVVDVCQKCFKEIKDELWDQRKNMSISLKAKVKDFIARLRN